MDFGAYPPPTASSMEALEKELADAARLQQTLGQFDLCTPNPFASEPRTPSSYPSGAFSYGFPLTTFLFPDPLPAALQRV